MNPSQLESLEAPQQPQSPSALDSSKQFLAGGLAGIAAKSFVAPLDRIKILFQVTDGRFSLSQVWVVTKDIMREEGPRGFFKGNSATMIRVFPYAGVQFFIFDNLKNRSLRRNAKERLDPVEGFVFGGIAGAVSSLTTYPLDLARTRLAVNITPGGVTTTLPHKRGPLGVLVQIAQVDGLSAIYRGILPTLLGIAPYAGIAFCLNDLGRTRVHTMLKRKPRTSDMMIIGGLAGLIAQTCTYPLEVVRRRMQSCGSIDQYGTAHGLFSSHNGNVRISPTTSKSALQPRMGKTMQLILEVQGIRGLYKGLSMNWVKGPVSISISFTTFDLLKDIFNV
eukprot:293833_1